MSSKVGIVIPTRNALSSLKDTLPEIRRALPYALIFGIDDKSKDGTKDFLKQNGAVVPFRFKRQGYGKSLIEGLTKAYYEYDCDCVIEMDADHPTEPLVDFLTGLQSYDMVIGIESTPRPTRKVAGFLVKTFLGLRSFVHPTCGYVAFTRVALQELFETKPRIKSNNDFVHVEILYKAKRRNISMGEMEFSGEHKRHRMSLKRITKWLISFSILTIKRFTWNIWIDLLSKLVRGD